ncbi:hypothetical protein CEXT_129531 [Caerostris extrusa]|uniref:Uncharacterized protein n=1 Tax=Caerostris extrusa TaxID=172846 RepID=A0AAV4X2L6_CAEEX|nr:hypothetical protein CEXT_129531 [Caerostris extrusa]
MNSTKSILFQPNRKSHSKSAAYLERKTNRKKKEEEEEKKTSFHGRETPPFSTPLPSRTKCTSEGWRERVDLDFVTNFHSLIDVLGRRSSRLSPARPQKKLIAISGMLIEKELDVGSATLTWRPVITCLRYNGTPATGCTPLPPKK